MPRRTTTLALLLVACGTEPKPPATQYVVVLDVKNHFEQSIVNEPVAGDLVALLAIDRGSEVEMVTQAKLHDNATAAFAVAKQALRAAHPTIRLSKMEETPVFTNDDLDESIAATILLPDLWKPYASQVQGDLLVAVPARARVFLTGGNDPGAAEGIGRIAGVAFQTEAHPLTAQIFKWSPTGWTVHALR